MCQIGEIVGSFISRLFHICGYSHGLIASLLHFFGNCRMHDSCDLLILVGEGRSTRSEEHTSELQSQSNLVCRLLLEKKKELTRDIHLPRLSLSLEPAPRRRRG